MQEAAASLGVAVRAQLNPFRPDDSYVARAEPGMSIAEIVGERAHAGVRVFIQDAEGLEHEVERARWASVRPKRSLIVRAMPRGGGDNKVERTVLMIAVIVASAYTGGAVGAAYGPGWGAVAQAGVVIAGTAAVDALVPLATPNAPNSVDSNDRVNSLTGQQNQLNQYGVPPVPFGTMQWFPPLAALPYTEVLGKNQYIRILLMLGYGELETLTETDIFIGDTDLTTYENVEFEQGTGTLSLYSNDVDQVTVGANLNDNFGTADPDSATRTTALDADEISLDIGFPQGLFGLDTQNGSVVVTAGLVISYSVAGAEAWVNIADPASSIQGLHISHPAMAVFQDLTDDMWEFKVTSGKRQPMHIGVRWKVPKGQYDVKIDRVHGPPYTYDGAAIHVSDCQWEVLRTIRHTTPCNIPGVNLLALRIEATDRLNGSVSQIAVRTQAKIPVYDADSETWTTEVSHNQAWQSIWVLRGAGGANNKPQNLSAIDLDSFVSWAADIDAADMGYDMVIDSQTTVARMLDDLAISGRARRGRGIHGLYTIVQDKDQTTPVQLFTPRNSKGLTCTKSFFRPHHALRVQFINPQAGWVQDERLVLADGYQSGGKDAHGHSAPSLPAATYIGTFLALGCTDPDLAWKQGRYELAKQWLRSSTYVFNADFENLRCTGGSLIRVSDDVIGAGIGWARIKAIVHNGASPPAAIKLQLDGTVTVGAGSYGVRVRQVDGVQVYSAISTGAGETDTLDLVTPMAIGDFSDLGAPVSGVSVGDVAVFGTAASESLELFITRVNYSRDLAAQITAVDRAPDVYTWDTGDIPGFVSAITGMPWCTKPPPPDISVILSGSRTGKVVDTGDEIQVPPVSAGGGTGTWDGVVVIDIDTDIG